MADIEVKSYTSSDGTKINKVNFYSGAYYVVSKVEGSNSREITPKLNSVEIDEANGVILCQKNLMINNDMLSKIYFHMNFEGEVISLAFSNLSDSLFGIEVSHEDDTYPFETFDRYLFELEEFYKERINNRV